MSVFRYIFWLAFLCLPLAIISQSIANAQIQNQTQQNDIPVSDLGVREQGQTYPLKLTAVNVDCDAPQDFEFEIDNTPWLTTPGNPVANGLGPGQQRSLPAQLDFTYTPPGIYYGHVTSRCTSCGWFIFASCVENGQDVVLKVTVADPADPQNGANLPQTPNPYAGMKPYAPSTISLNPPINKSDESLLTAEDRNRLYVARSRVKSAQKKGEKARDDVRAARLKKNDCERELARLKAAMQAANRKAAIADQDAANAQGAADAAAKALANFAKDKADAAMAYKLADEGARRQTTYLVDVISSDGGNSPRALQARQFLKDADAKKKAAREAQKKIDNSFSARKQAAEQAQKSANAAKANAAGARANANAATARYNAKARECHGLTAAKAEADKRLLDAENAAKHTVGIANYEESEAKKKADKARKEAIAQGVRDLEKELKKKKKKCARQREVMAAEIAKLKRAMDVGQKLKIFEDDGGKKANMLKQVNDKIWDTAQDLAQDHTFVSADAKGNRGIANDNTADLISLDTVEDIAGRVQFAMESFMDHLSGKFRSGGVPGVGQDQMLGGLKALAMAVQGQVTAIRNPNTLAAMRNENADLRRNEESFQAQKMKDMGIGKNAAERAEIQKTINDIYRKPNLISDLIQRSGEQAARCANEIKKLEAKIAAAKSAK